MATPNANATTIVVFPMGLSDSAASMVNPSNPITEKMSEGAYSTLIKPKRNTPLIANSSSAPCLSFFGKYSATGRCTRATTISTKGITIRKKAKENKNCSAFGDNQIAAMKPMSTLGIASSNSIAGLITLRRRLLAKNAVYIAAPMATGIAISSAKREALILPINSGVKLNFAS